MLSILELYKATTQRYGAGMHDLKIIEVRTTQTEEDLLLMIKGMYPLAVGTETGFILTIGGFDDDPRGLWDIPEAVGLCHKLCQLGLISLLEASTSVPLLMSSLCKELKYGMGIGAFETWWIAQGRKAGTSIDRNDLNRFKDEWLQSNAVCNANYRKALNIQGRSIRFKDGMYRI